MHQIRFVVMGKSLLRAPFSMHPPVSLVKSSAQKPGTIVKEMQTRVSSAKILLIYFTLVKYAWLK